MFNEQMNLQREQTAMQVGAGDPMSINKETERGDLLRWQQELDDQLILLKHELRNKEWDETIGQWTTKTQADGTPLPPKLNEAGISHIMSLVRPLLSRNLINSNLDEDFVRNMLRKTCDDLVGSLAIYGESWQADFGDYSAIVRIVKNYVIPTPFRAVNGWNKKTDSTISRRMEAFTEVGQRKEQPKGFFRNMFPGG